MRQYEFLTGKDFKSISDGTSFVVTTSMEAYRECKNGFSMRLYCIGDMYWLFTVPPDYFSTYSDTTREFQNVKWKPKDDKNFVIRVDKLAGVDNLAFTTYINGEYLASTRSWSDLVTLANGSTIDISFQPPGLPITLVIFNDSELGNGDGSEGATAMHGRPPSTPRTHIHSPDADIAEHFDLNGDGSEGVTATQGGPSSMPRMHIYSPDADIAGHFDLNGNGLASRTELYPPNANIVNLLST